MPARKQIVRTNKVILPELQSQAVRTPRLLFISGLVATTGQSAEIADSDMETQTGQVLENMKAVLEEAGLTLANVIRVMVFIRVRAEFQRMNSVYVRYFATNPPSRTCTTVADMYPWARVQMSAVASYEPNAAADPGNVTSPTLHPALINLPAGQRRTFYSQAVSTPSFTFLSGIVGTAPDRGDITDPTFEGQATRALASVRRVLDAKGLGVDNIVSLTALLQDRGDAVRLRELYAGTFAHGQPPQCAVAEGEHYPGSKVEIIAVAANDPHSEAIVADGNSLKRARVSSLASDVRMLAVKAKGLLFVTGLTGLEEGERGGSIEDHTRRALERLARILAAAGASLSDVVNVTVFLRSSTDRDGFNRVYAGFFPNDPPARASATMVDLQPGARLEIVAIASCET